MAQRHSTVPEGVVLNDTGATWGAGRPPKYPWPEWTDGNWWTAIRGEDFDCTVMSFRTSLSEAASRRGLKYHSQVTSPKGAPREVIAFQFYKEVPGDRRTRGPQQASDVEGAVLHIAGQEFDGRQA